MKRRIKAAVSVMIVIALLLCPISAFAAQYQGTIKWYYSAGEEIRYFERPYYGELTLGTTTVEPSASDSSGEHVFKMTAQDAGWYYVELRADSSWISTLSTQKEIREDGMPFEFSQDDCFLVFEKGESTKGAILRFDAGEVRYLDFNYANKGFIINVEYLGEMLDVVPEQGMLDNLELNLDFRILVKERKVSIYTGNFTAQFSGGKSVVLYADTYPYSGEISHTAGRYDITLDFAGFKKAISISFYDLSAEIERVVVENLDELTDTRLTVCYDGTEFLENDYEADITVYFKDGTVEKAGCSSKTGVSPFTAPNGRDYFAYVFFVRNGGDCDIVLDISETDYVETIGSAVLARASLSVNLRIFRYNYEQQKDLHRDNLLVFFFSELMSAIMFSLGQGEL